MTEGQKNMVLAAIDAAEIWESATGKKEFSLRVGSEFFKTLKELVAEPCEDSVSREAVKSVLCELCGDKNSCPFVNGDCDDLNAINALPPVTPKPKAFEWIPVKDPYTELPKSDTLWVTRNDCGCRWIDTVNYDMTEWSDDIHDVTAYAFYEQPEPYKEGESE